MKMCIKRNGQKKKESRSCGETNQYKERHEGVERERELLYIEKKQERWRYREKNGCRKRDIVWCGVEKETAVKRRQMDRRRKRKCRQRNGGIEREM